MMTPQEWSALSQKTLRPKAVKAPPFLWTRIQAAIEAQEALKAPWWIQWRWMTRFTLTASALAMIISFLLLNPIKEVPLENLLEGQPHVQEAIQVASSRLVNTDHTAGFILEDQPSWVDD